MRDDFGLMTEGIAPAGTRIRELAFLHEIAQLATQARDWDELMRSIVDGTTAAMGVEVCSFYLADHERTRLTLAATNGLDRSQVGTVSLAWGEGITGRVAATRRPIAVEDVTSDPRFAWVRGFDIEGLAGMLSVPLVWHDEVVGVLNVQTRAVRRFEPAEVDLLQTIAALLAGIVEKGRLTAEVEARLAQLTALDAAAVGAAERRDARAAHAAVGRSRLRRPARRGRRGNADADGLARGGQRPTRRLDRLVDSILASVRGEGLTGLSRAPFDAIGAVDDVVETLRLLLRPHPIRWERPDRTDDGDRRRDAIPAGPRAASRERVEVRADREGREHRHLAPGRRGPGLRHRRRPGRARRGVGERLRAVRPGRQAGAGRAGPASGCSPPGGSWKRWAAASSSSRTGTPARASWSRCRPARRRRLARTLRAR